MRIVYETDCVCSFASCIHQNPFVHNLLVQKEMHCRGGGAECTLGSIVDNFFCLTMLAFGDIITSYYIIEVFS